jgi:predicted CXXCH cytochrome family protein
MFIASAFCRPCEAQLGNIPPKTGKDCTICHLEWVESFQHSDRAILLDAPNHSVVAEADACLDCHDGSVADSRRQVWVERSHSVGVKPSAGMNVPAELPLDNGQVSCRTCHTAHAAGFNESLKDAVFLRIRNERDQLCKACHTDKTQGTTLGSHSLAQLDRPFPNTLLAAGAHAGPRHDQVLCQSCHTAHGGKDQQLLLMQTDASQLCITCHETMRPAMWDKDPTHNHPQNPPIHKPEQIRAIADMKTQLGAEDHLVCLSCHKMHNAQPGKAILADTLHDSTMCIRCHQDKKAMIATAHDLRKSAPNELNARGESIGESGFCGACHTFHSYTRKRTPMPGDPQGLCSNCHSPGQVAAKHVGTMFHPVNLPVALLKSNSSLPMLESAAGASKSMTCLTCHDPHAPKHAPFLRAEKTQLCAECHADLAQSLAKPHDFSDRRDIENALGQTPAAAGRCGFCHSVHQAKGPMMLAATDAAIKVLDDACTQCHRLDGMARDHPKAVFNHPSGSAAIVKQAIDLKLPLFKGSVACGSCHDVHGNERVSSALLRAATATELCTQCHASEAKMASGKHDPRITTTPGHNKDLCLICHRAHGNDRAKQLWTVSLASGQTGGDAACTACHGDQLWSDQAVATRAGATLHPHAIPANSVVMKPHQLPLGPNAAILCATCHDPHASPRVPSLLRIEARESANEICAKCHAEAQQLKTSMHESSHLLPADQNPQQACAPCHRVHSAPRTVKQLLWSSRVFEKGKDQAEQMCLGCHSESGRAAAPAVYSHPRTTLADIKLGTTQPTTLTDRFGNINRITCTTCHLAHGCDSATTPDSVDVLSTKPMLRPDVARSVCAACHGLDASRRYLYFHDERKRLATARVEKQE